MQRNKSGEASFSILKLKKKRCNLNEIIFIIEVFSAVTFPESTQRNLTLIIQKIKCKTSKNSRKC